MAHREGIMGIGKPLLILSGLLLSAALAQAAPVALGDGALDRVTAGAGETGGSGGAIVGNSSNATISQTGGVDLSGETQSGAKALNLVNSAESTVANGVNVWDVRRFESPLPLLESGTGGVEQSNVVFQEQRRSASMPSYSRPNANTFTQVDRTGSEAHNNNLNRDNTIYDATTSESIAHNVSNASVDTRIVGGVDTKANTSVPADKQLPASPAGNVNTNTGKGVAISGQMTNKIDGGEAHFGLAVGGAVIAKPDDSAGRFGGLDVGDKDKSQVALYGRLILPDVEITINGSGCGVAMGSCESSGTADLTEKQTVNKNKMAQEVSSSVGNSQFTDNSAETYRSAFNLSNAQAEYIVVDDSNLTVNTQFNLSLSGAAQANASGMNVVNATGSAVADGVNIARTSQMMAGAGLSLKQSNMISHSR